MIPACIIKSVSNNYVSNQVKKGKSVVLSKSLMWVNELRSDAS